MHNCWGSSKGLVRNMLQLALTVIISQTLILKPYTLNLIP